MSTALVVSGGGSKGAFAVGAIRHLVTDLGLSFDIVCGTSTGALMAPFVVTGEIDELVRLYTTMETEDIVVRRPLSSILTTDSIFDVQPLANQVTSVITPDRATAVLQSQKRMFLTTVCLQTGRITYFQSGPAAQAPTGCDMESIRTRARLIRAMMASADMPALMPPIEMSDNSAPARQYVDGGARERAPLEVALRNGATEIYAIVLAPKQAAPQETRFQSVPGILMRTIGMFTDDVLLHDLLVVESAVRGRRYLDGLRQRVAARLGVAPADLDALFADEANTPNVFSGPPVNLHVIRPQSEIPIETLTFVPGIMAALVEEGRQRAVIALNDPREWLA